MFLKVDQLETWLSPIYPPPLVRPFLSWTLTNLNVSSHWHEKQGHVQGVFPVQVCSAGLWAVLFSVHSRTAFFQGSEASSCSWLDPPVSRATTLKPNFILFVLIRWHTRSKRRFLPYFNNSIKMLHKTAILYHPFPVIMLALNPGFDFRKGSNVHTWT